MGVAGGLRPFLRRHRVMGADSMVFIYHLEDHPRYAPITQVIFDDWERGTSPGATSVVTITGATGFITNDEGAKRVQDIEVLLLEEAIRSR